MSPQTDRYRWIAAEFTKRVEAVPAGAWDAPAPCPGWVARDVVGHLVEWVPGYFFPLWGISSGPIPSVDDDPAAAWAALDATLSAALSDPAVADAERDTPMGTMGFAAAFDLMGTTDVFLHTWDLARATGGDERLDPDESRRLYEGMLPLDEMLREGGQYGPRTPVPDDADAQTTLLAFIGRTP